MVKLPSMPIFLYKMGHYFRSRDPTLDLEMPLSLSTLHRFMPLSPPAYSVSLCVCVYVCVCLCGVV